MVLFYGNYENFVVNNFTINYTDSSTINIELNLQEILLRDLQNFEDIDIPYQMIEELSEEDKIKMEYALSKIYYRLSSGYSSSVISKEELEEYYNTYSQGGHYE